MANQVIVQDPHPALNTVCEELTQEDFDSGLVKELEQDLIDTLGPKTERGVALSANQIAVTKRMFVSRDPSYPEKFLTFVNPVIVKQSKATIHKGEGCLSIEQTKRYNVPRYNRVKVKWQNAEGTHFNIQFRGFMAFVMQHEIDHLNGLLINENDSDEEKGYATAADLALMEKAAEKILDKST